VDRFATFGANARDGVGANACDALKIKALLRSPSMDIDRRSEAVFVLNRLARTAITVIMRREGREDALMNRCPGSKVISRAVIDATLSGHGSTALV